MKGAPNPAGGRRLIDFALAQEARLAAGGGYQYPMGVGTVPRPHPQLKTRREVKPLAVEFEAAADRWEEAQAFLRNEFAR